MAEQSSGKRGGKDQGAAKTSPIKAVGSYSFDKRLGHYEQLMSGLTGVHAESFWRRVWRNIRAAFTRQPINPLNLRNYELRWRIHARKWYGRWFLLLLLVQNGFIFYLVYRAYADNRLDKLSLVFSTLVAGTLIETAYIFRIIVTQLFKDIEYQNYIDRTGRTKK